MFLRFGSNSINSSKKKIVELSKVSKYSLNFDISELKLIFELLINSNWVSSFESSISFCNLFKFWIVLSISLKIVVKVVFEDSLISFNKLFKGWINIGVASYKFVI